MERKKVLLAEDDADFGMMLKQYLELHEFEVERCTDGQEALEQFVKMKAEGMPPPDICVFDVMMPRMDGFALAEKVIGIYPEIPFVFLTAKKMKEDRLRGLRLGADDYILKPFEADILVLRLRNILKRAQQVSAPMDEAPTASIGEFRFDPQQRLLTHGENQRAVTEKEALLIDYFIQHRNQLVSREELMTAVWGSDDFFTGRSMDVFISRLRKYFKADSSITIETTRGLGLTFKINE